MGFLNIFFGKKDNVNIEEETINEGGCDFCGSNFTHYDDIKKFDKKKYHIKCFKKLKQQTKKLVFG